MDDVMYERARLVLTDPDGELDSLDPLDHDTAWQIIGAIEEAGR